MAGVSTRRRTIATDPEFLDELKKRHRVCSNSEAHEAALATLSESELDAAFGAVVQGSAQDACSWLARARLPAAGWFSEASEEPYSLRAWHLLPSSEEASLSPDGCAKMQKLGIAALCCKGLKEPEDSQLGQDNFCVAQLVSGWQAFGVFDGHGRQGEWPSQRLARSFPVILQSGSCAAMLRRGEVSSALTEAFRLAHEDLLSAAREAEQDLRCTGSTATVALWHPSQAASVWVGTVGDSRAVLFSTAAAGEGYRGAVLCETSDHKPTRSDEAKRVEQSGGRVIATQYKNGAVDTRVAPKGLSSPQISVSRAFGDLVFKDSGVIADPEIVEWSLEGHEVDAALLIGSDGLWEFLSSCEAVQMLQDAGCSPGFGGGEQALHKLMSQAQHLWREHEEVYCDDITMVLTPLGASAALPSHGKSDSCAADAAGGRRCLEEFGPADGINVHQEESQQDSFH